MQCADCASHRSGSMERNVLEFVDHLHEHFVWPVSINENGRYKVPLHSDEGYSIKMHDASIAEYSYPDGSFWRSETGKKVVASSKFL